VESGLTDVQVPHKVLEIQHMMHRAVAIHGHGALAQAEALYRSILQADPCHASALQNLGVALLDQGRAVEALDMLDRSIALDAGNAVAWSNRGNVLGVLGRASEALSSYDQAVILDPGYARAFSNRCDPLTTLGRFDEALASAQQALRLQPRFPAALNNRGKAQMALGLHQQAFDSFDAALELQPGWSLALGNRSQALLHLHRIEEALRDADRAVQQAPRDPHAQIARGNAQRALQRFLPALDSYDQALRIMPDMRVAHYNRAHTLRDMDRPLEALASFDQALGVAQQSADAHHGRGLALLRLHRLAEAGAALARAVELCPDLPYARGQALHTAMQLAQWRNYEEHARALIAANAHGECADEPLSFLAVSASAAAQLVCASTYVAHRYPPRPVVMPGRRRPQDGRIHLAYLSGDFGDHPVSYLMAGVFERHERRCFQTSALALRPAGSGAYARRIQSSFDRYLEVQQRTDDEIAAIVRSMQVDVLVDLMGFTRGTRLGVLAHRPAPVQVSYLGYPGTMGAPYVDYLLADEYVVPPHLKACYSEQIVYLPDCYQANDDRRVFPTAPTRAEAGLPPTGVVFCAFNATCKITPQVFDTWCRLLHAVPASVLWLLGESASARANLRREAASRGLASQRLLFAERLDYERHLARLRLADLYLDTFPFNAGASASDALWAGVPLITCSGEAFAARMAGSQLQAVGLSELICLNLRQYEQLALALATDDSRLRSIQARLRERRSSLPLFDSARFCRHIEYAYALMHERAQRGEAAQGFTVPRLQDH
jgi:predicted O-linked N-acetylglucosamine transferase (SPINDLY family)